MSMNIKIKAISLSILFFIPFLMNYSISASGVEKISLDNVSSTSEKSVCLTLGILVSVYLL